MKPGDQVRQKAPTVTGQITDVRYNKDAAELEYLVEYVDQNGLSQCRWFNESEVEQVIA